jgi:hypothetical protein
VFLVSGSSAPDEAVAPVKADPHDVPAAEAPTIDLAATPDSGGGWNLHLVTTRFVWAPEHSGGTPVDGEGYAQVLVGATTVGRAYGEWFYLPESLVPVGEQTVRVVLNGNDGGDYRAAGVSVAGTVTVVSQAEAAADGHHHQH